MQSQFSPLSQYSTEEIKQSNFAASGYENPEEAPTLSDILPPTVKELNALGWMSLARLNNTYFQPTGTNPPLVKVNRIGNVEVIGIVRLVSAPPDIAIFCDFPYEILDYLMTFRPQYTLTNAMQSYRYYSSLIFDTSSSPRLLFARTSAQTPSVVDYININHTIYCE